MAIRTTMRTIQSQVGTVILSLGARRLYAEWVAGGGVEPSDVSADAIEGAASGAVRRLIPGRDAELVAAGGHSPRQGRFAVEAERSRPDRVRERERVAGTVRPRIKGVHLRTGYFTISFKGVSIGG
jgi:hypothetical protein